MTNPTELCGRGSDFDKLAQQMLPKLPTAGDAPVRPSKTPHALTGIGGIGKTQLALYYAHRHRNHYKQVLWVPAAGPDIEPKFAALAFQLGLYLTPTTHRAQAVREELERGDSYLLILDDVTDSAAVLPHLPRFGATSVILTTRRSDLMWATQQRLEALTEHAALQMLAGDDVKDAELAAARTLSQVLGGHPLALCAAADAAAHRGGSLERVCKSIERRGLQAWLRSTRVPHRGKKTSLDAVITDAAALPLPRLAQAMVLVSGQHGTGAMATEDLLAAAGARHATSRWECLRVLEDLVDRGLAQLDSRDSVRFHRLVQHSVAALQSG